MLERLKVLFKFPNLKAPALNNFREELRQNPVFKGEPLHKHYSTRTARICPHCRKMVSNGFGLSAQMCRCPPLDDYPKEQLKSTPTPPLFFAVEVPPAPVTIDLSPASIAFLNSEPETWRGKGGTMDGGGASESWTAPTPTPEPSTPYTPAPSVSDYSCSASSSGSSSDSSSSSSSE